MDKELTKADFEDLFRKEEDNNFQIVKDMIEKEKDGNQMATLILKENINRGKKRKKIGGSGEEEAAAAKKKKKEESFLLMDHAVFLMTLASKKITKDQKQKLIENIKPQQFNAVLEILANFLSNKYNVSPDIMKKLNKNIEYLDYLFNKKIPMDLKKEIMIQKGGFLQALIPIALGVAKPLLSSVISEIFK